MSNLFDVVPEEEVVTIDESKDYVAELVGEGKKFKDVSQLAKGKFESDQYIAMLTKKLDELKTELNTRTSLDAFLDKMKTDKITGQPEPVATPSDQPSVALDDSILEAKLAEILSKKEQQTTQASNLEKVTSALQQQFGDQAKLVLNHKAKEVGMSVQALQSLAAQSPEAFFRLVGVQNNVPSGVATPKNTVNSFASEPMSVVRDSKYYEKLKRENPTKYFSNQTTVEMIKDMQSLRSRGLPW